MILSIQNKLELPSIKKVIFKRKLFQDIIFFLVVVALPSSFFALLPSTFFYDLRLVFLLLSTLYIPLYISFIKKIVKLPGGIALIVLNLFLFFQIIYSILYHEIPFTEVATVFRTKFFYPIATLGFLLYVASMDNDRIYRFMYWVLFATFLQGSLYVFSNITGLNPFAQISKEFSTFQGEVIMQNMFAIPHYNEILFAFALLTALTAKKFKKHWLWVIPLLVTVISIVRSQMIVYLLVFILIFILSKISKLKLNLSKIFNLSIIVVLFIVLISFTFPSHLARVIDKFGFDEKEHITASDYTEEGTYAVRLRLIKDAYTRTESNNNLLLGNGYKREATKGEYDFVVGDDTLIAPVLFTEGFAGLVFRIIPILLLLFYFMKSLLSKNKKYKLFAIVAIALILPEILNAVQTKYFVYYTRVVFVLFVLAMVTYNDKRIKYEKNLP